MTRSLLSKREERLADAFIVGRRRGLAADDLVVVELQPLSSLGARLLSRLRVALHLRGPGPASPVAVAVDRARAGELCPALAVELLRVPATGLTVLEIADRARLVWWPIAIEVDGGGGR